MDYSQHDWGNPFIDMNSHGHEVSASITIYHHWDIVVTTNENGSLIVLRLVSSTLTMYIINLDINQNTVYVA